MKLMQQKELGQLIAKIGRNRGQFDKLVQQAAVQAIGFTIVDRNISPCADLVLAVGDHLEATLIAFLEKFGNVMWSKAEKKLVFVDRATLPEGSPFHAKLEWTEEYAATIADTPWTAAKPKPQPKSQYDMEQEVSKFLDRMLKVATKDGVEVKNKDLIGRLYDTYRKYVADTFVVQTTEPTLADRITLAEEAVAGNKATPEQIALLKKHFGQRDLKAA